MWLINPVSADVTIRVVMRTCLESCPRQPHMPFGLEHLVAGVALVAWVIMSHGDQLGARGDLQIDVPKLIGVCGACMEALRATSCWVKVTW